MHYWTTSDFLSWHNKNGSIRNIKEFSRRPSTSKIKLIVILAGLNAKNGLRTTQITDRIFKIIEMNHWIDRSSRYSKCLNIWRVEPIINEATSMLVTDVGNEMCWWQFEDVGDGFGHFGHQNPLSLNISLGHQHPKDVTKILILSPTF